MNEENNFPFDSFSEEIFFDAEKEKYTDDWMLSFNYQDFSTSCPPLSSSNDNQVSFSSNDEQKSTSNDRSVNEVLKPKAESEANEAMKTDPVSDPIKAEIKEIKSVVPKARFLTRKTKPSKPLFIIKTGLMQLNDVDCNYNPYVSVKGSKIAIRFPQHLFQC